MATELIDVAIKGTSALLMHRYPLEPIEAIAKKTAEEQAEIAAYRTEDGKLYIPGVNIQRAFVAGATFSKGKGTRTLAKEVAACVFVSPEHVILEPQTYTIDARRVVIKNAGAIVRVRPKIDGWSCSFHVEYDPTLLTEVQLRKIIDDTGSRVGLLDFRPEKKGPFGRFIVTVWENHAGTKKKKK